MGSPAALVVETVCVTVPKTVEVVRSVDEVADPLIAPAAFPVLPPNFPPTGRVVLANGIAVANELAVGTLLETGAEEMIREALEETAATGAEEAIRETLAEMAAAEAEEVSRGTLAETVALTTPIATTDEASMTVIVLPEAEDALLEADVELAETPTYSSPQSPPVGSHVDVWQ